MPILSVFTFYGGIAIFILRIAVAGVLITHGWSKLNDAKKTAAWFQSIGLKSGKLFAILSTLLEFFGGIGLLFGFLVQFIAFFAILQFLIIIVWKLSHRMPLIGSWEMDLMLLAAAVVLFFIGGGSFALDHVFFL